MRTLNVRRRRPAGSLAACASVALGLSLALAATPAYANPPDPPYPGGQDVAAPDHYLIGGYISSGNPNFSTWDMQNANVAYWAFSTIGEPGQANDGQCTPASAAGLQSVAAFRADNPDKKIIRSIGGWGGRGFTYAVRTQEGREKLAKSCIERFLDTGAADGFDFDWEFPVSGGPPYIGADPADKENHNLMVIEFRKQMNEWAARHNVDPDDLWLTAAIPAGRWQDDGTGTDTGAPYNVLNSFDLEFLGRTLNTINIMTYEMGTGYVPVSMPNQPLYPDPKDNTGMEYNSGVEMVQLFIDQGVDPMKISYGAMFTGGRGFVVSSNDNGGMWQPWTATGCGSGANAVNLQQTLNDSRNVLPFWDDTTKNQWFFDPDQKRVCSVESPQSLRIRAEWAKERGLNGFYSWTLNTTSGSNHAELRSVARVFYPEWVTEPAPPTLVGARVLPVKGQEWTGEVARITGAANPITDAVINWGDFTRSRATLVDLGGGTWSIRGTHTYAETGSYEMTVATFDTLPINNVMGNAWASVGLTQGVNENLEVDVLPGQLSLKVSSDATVDFGNVTASGGDQMVDAALRSAIVTDSRGTGEGWTLAGTASNFVGDLTGERIMAANLGWYPWANSDPTSDLGLVHARDVSQAVRPGPSVAPARPDGLSVPKVLCAGDLGSSTGRFECGATLRLGIPWSTAADHYTSVLTLTLI